VKSFPRPRVAYDANDRPTITANTFLRMASQSMEPGCVLCELHKKRNLQSAINSGIWAQLKSLQERSRNEKWKGSGNCEDVKEFRRNLAHTIRVDRANEDGRP
jgi:hypothetical protein